MKELINQYQFEADRIAEYINALKAELADESDIELVNRLRERLKVLEEERYEILCDIKDMKIGQSFALPKIM